MKIIAAIIGMGVGESIYKQLKIIEVVKLKLYVKKIKRK